MCDPRGIGPVLQTNPTPVTAPPTTINASGNYYAGVMLSGGFKAISVGATLSQMGSIVVKRYIDSAGTVLLDTTTVALTATTPGAVALNDSKAFAAFDVTVNNTGGSTGNLSAFAMLLAAG
jgi:hypothetical protein